MTVWGIGERKLGGDFGRRMMIFDYMVKSIMLYGAEMWGWKNYSVLEALQRKYIKWVLGLHWLTPNYIVLEEAKRNLISIESGIRAAKYEQKIRINRKNEILDECITEIDKKNNKTAWRDDRRKYFERNGWGELSIKNEMNKGKYFIQNLKQRDIDNQKQDQKIKIENSKSNLDYKNKVSPHLPAYLTLKKGIKCLREKAKDRCHQLTN